MVKAVVNKLNLLGAYEEFYKGKATVKKGELIHKQLENHLKHNSWFKSAFQMESLDELVAVTKEFLGIVWNYPVSYCCLLCGL